MVDPTLVSTVSLLIKKGRVERSLSQGELAKLIGTTRQSVNQYEQGRMLPQLPILLKLARALDLDLENLKVVFG